jgi:hypothetical protein
MTMTITTLSLNPIFIWVSHQRTNARYTFERTQFVSIPSSSGFLTNASHRGSLLVGRRVSIPSSSGFLTNLKSRSSKWRVSESQSHLHLGFSPTGVSTTNTRWRICLNPIFIWVSHQRSKQH